jgi:DNA polymerase-3 subunit epsilon
MTKVIILDTETTGKSPIKPGSKWGEDYFKKSSDPTIWPRIVQISFITYDLDQNKPIEIYSNIIKLKDTQYPIPIESVNIHGITDEISRDNGVSINDVLSKFVEEFLKSDLIVGHNIQFDINVVCAELALILNSNEITNRYEKNKFIKVYDKLMNDYYSKYKYCTMRKSKAICALPKYKYGDDGEFILNAYGEKVEKLNLNGKPGVKNPKLSEAYYHLFKETPQGKLHDSIVDVAVCLRIFMKLYKDLDIFSEEIIKYNIEIVNIVNPTKTNESPIKTNESPKKINESPIKTNESPIKTNESPIKTNESPKKINISLSSKKRRSHKKL